VNAGVGRTNRGLFEKSKDKDRGMYNVEVAPEPDLALEARTPLGFQVQVTRDRWRLITTVKHPVMVGREDAVRLTLEQPEQVRESRSVPEVLLFYRLERPGRWICAVAKRAAADGFLITAYPTDAIKEGTQIWPK
jgi:hypothetical protein